MFCPLSGEGRDLWDWFNCRGSVIVVMEKSKPSEPLHPYEAAVWKTVQCWPRLRRHYISNMKKISDEDDAVNQNKSGRHAAVGVSDHYSGFQVSVLMWTVDLGRSWEQNRNHHIKVSVRQVWLHAVTAACRHTLSNKRLLTSRSW